MDKQLRIILTYQDQATAGIARSVSAIGAATSGLQAGISKGFSGLTGVVSGFASNLVGVVGGALGRVKNSITGMVSHFRWASLFIGTIAIGVGAKIVGIAANAEQTRVAFETLLKSPKKAGEFMTWIEDLSIKTPLMRSEIEQAAKTFLAYAMPLNTAKRATMAAVEATSALGLADNKLARISVNLGQIYNSQTVREMELKELRLAGVQVNKIFIDSIKDGTPKLKGLTVEMVNASKATGEISEETLKWIKANVTGKDMFDILEKGMMKLYGGASIRQVKTFSGAISNFGDVFDKVIKRTFGIASDGTIKIGGAFDIIRNAAAKLIDYLINNVDKIANFFNKFLSNKDNLIGLAGIFIGMLVPAILAIIGPIVLLGGVIGFLVSKSLPKIRALVDQFGGMGVVVGKAKKAFEKLSDILKDLAENKTVQDTLKGIAFIVGVVLAGAFIAWAAPIAITVGVLAGLGWIVGKIVEKMGGWNNVLTITKNVLNNVKDAVQGLISFIQDHEEVIKALIIGFATAIITILIPPLLLWLATQLSIAAAVVISFAPVLLVIAVITAAVALLYLAWTENWGGIQDKVRAVVDWFDTTARPILETAFELIKKAAELLFKAWKKVVDETWEAMKKLLDFINEHFVPEIDEDFKKLGALINKELPLWTKAINIWKDAFLEVVHAVQKVMDKIDELTEKARNSAVGRAILGPLGVKFESWQHGGIVPGQVGQAVPIMAHGGERIIPRGSNSQAPFGGGGGGGVTVNMNGPITMDSPERVKELANSIIKILGRQNELSRYGLL